MEQEHISGKIVAKTVVIKADNQIVLAVLPASLKIDMEKFREALGALEARFATELEFAGLFPDCEVGAMPPFGNLYGLPVYCEQSLAEDDEIVFNEGTHQDTIRMKYADYSRLAHPRLVNFALVRVA